MKVMFTHDFGGKITRELHYRAGDVLDVDDDVAAELIALHHAVAVEQYEAPAPVEVEGTPEIVIVEDETVVEEIIDVVIDEPPVEEKPKGRGRDRTKD